MITWFRTLLRAYRMLRFLRRIEAARMRALLCYTRREPFARGRRYSWERMMKVTCWCRRREERYQRGYP